MDFPLLGLSRTLYYSFHERHLPNLYTQSNISTSPILSSLLNPLTSLTLHRLPRRHPSNRLSNTNCSLLLRRKLWIPLFQPPNTPSCICGTQLLIHLVIISSTALTIPNYNYTINFTIAFTPSYDILPPSLHLLSPLMTSISNHTTLSQLFFKIDTPQTLVLSLHHLPLFPLLHHTPISQSM